MYLHIEHMDLRNKQSETAQKELISNISHDIKTPLTTLNAYVDAILAGVCPDLPSVMRYVKVIHIHSEKMVHLVDDLFYHSLQQLGHISVAPAARYSKDVFGQILPAMKQMATARHILLTEPADIPNVLIQADIGRIEQVMANLVQNAIKHTPEGGSIQIDFAIENNRFKTSIIDNGEGISPEDIPYVFDRYYQGHYKNDQKNDGAGLGLSICKYIIEHHDGEIYFKTIKGEGTSFYFSLPMI
jgi:K+-sensing histidine kinase KdpD